MTEMSRVQVSLSSIGPARGNFSPQRPRRSVCRSLFGPVDHDELHRDIEAKLREISEKDEQRWNFNFASGTPLLGDYEWEGAAVEATPVFYQEAVQVGKKRAVALQVQPYTEAPNRENCAQSDAAKTGAVSREDTRTGRKAGCTRTRKARARVTKSPCRITDFYVKRRKLGPESVSQKAFSSLSSEQTPRKRLR
ncbi:cyclin-dependent kinase inhibitor 1B [Clarias gariepinus]|uniref:cyclin-dependent kinase inhibitor 1B-like n=1 Tax=Clarias gariepinus TaxID=13013 RepID=UPI00234D5C07|nr:cyclin-dependent kinase inhibitor 1B-like [Clarias gariepinus]